MSHELSFDLRYDLLIAVGSGAPDVLVGVDAGILYGRYKLFVELLCRRIVTNFGCVIVSNVFF